MYIHQLKNWPKFQWDEPAILPQLAAARHQQGRLLGKMEGIGFSLQEEATLQTLTQDVVKSSEIEGEILDAAQVRSSIARRLGMEIAGLTPSDRNVDGVVEMMLDATQSYQDPLSEDRLFGWHAALFPTGRSGMHKIAVGHWRNNSKEDPMQVVSGPMGREIVHYQAPDAELLASEMGRFIEWFNSNLSLDPVLKAGIAHLWFVTIHPFDDGNGRIARAIADMQLARADQTAQRFYSMSAQIRIERNRYYDMLEYTQKGTLDITEWLTWFLDCYGRALQSTDQTLAKVMAKARFWDNPATRAINERQRLMLNKLLESFEGKLTSSKWAKIAKCSQDTAGRDIQQLIKLGILAKEEGGGRNTSYTLREVREWAKSFSRGAPAKDDWDINRDR
ncbi:Fic family protein [Mucilaginibacter gracilis]|uniref:Fic family protein n=1 Tax=Mucilaginibacter gracilis TaxID=423350 RepID=A0A495J765_9SPHI|nr:Fic family protein [Mucilaginibacter gracilis]RKR84214.1 Fic family protein [Mucilaginibacter gracilis]